MEPNRRTQNRTTDILKRALYSEICSHDGIKAKDIGKHISADITVWFGNS